ncbi:glycosyltransferase family 4 protein [Cellulomonas sp. URHE0023]|uniref:glycosyltransferase family 4 protein n=1 Tax=Cellulomonas sp. URHE0023 TaxID=1380354 RepID=UPI000489231A|nr:glycosyltransferase family 4 protein [Cellulomonas sp. URHE0023]
MDVCSIAARAEAAALRVTLDSLRVFHPDVVVHVLDLDGVADWPDVRVLRLTDIGVTDRELHAAAMLADPTHLTGWLQPRLLRYFVGRGEPVLSIAPGVRALGPLDALLAEPLDASIRLVARHDGLPADDGFRPSAADMFEAGTFHGSVLACGPGSLGLVDSWIALSDPGLPTPWQNAATAGPHETLPAGTMLSRWMLEPGTKVLCDRDGWSSDDVPTLLADLTEFDPHRPWLLSTVDPDEARARLSDHPLLRDLCRVHAKELEAAPIDPSVSFDTTADGIPVHGALRLAFRKAVDSWRSGTGHEPPDPFDTSDPGAFTAWLDEVTSRDGGPLTRYLRAIYDDRPDLQARYPQVPGADVGPLLRWAETHARLENDYETRLIDSALRAGHRGRPTEGVVAGADGVAHGSARRPAGVNVAGYLHGELGIGESARLMVSALKTTDVPYSTIAVGRHLQHRQDVTLGSLAGAGTLFDVTLLCVNAEQTGDVLEAEPRLLQSSYRIGMWYWEVEEFPAAKRGGFGHVDEVWVASDFIRQAIAPHTTRPVLTVTPPLPQARAATTRVRGDFGLPEDRPVFLFSFDYLSTAERKNPVGLIDAFRIAFAPNEGPVLVVKSINADKRVGDAERVRQRAADEPDVVLLEEYLSTEERDALVQLCDVYVSLHRSEGLGLTIAEAMAYGKPVVVTAYSGNLQFTTDENAFLVPWVPGVVPDNAEPYPAGTQWAEPDLEEAARLMRLALEDPALAAAKGARAAWTVRELHSPEVAGRHIAARLAQIRRELPRHRWRVRVRRARNLLRRTGLLR